MRVFLTGASGFVGQHVARQLCARGCSVNALVRATSKRPKLDVNWQVGDVTDRATLAAAIAGCEVVIHTAAQVSFTRGQAQRQREINVEGTHNLLEAARNAGVRRVVHTSSIAAIGRSDGIANEATEYDWPKGAYYNESKRDSERLVLAETAIETICVNPALVFGPDEFAARTLPIFKYGRWIAPPGGTTLCHVEDVAAAHVAAIERGRAGERYILGGPHVSYRELFALAVQAGGRRGPKWVIPERLIRAARSALRPFEPVGVPVALLNNLIGNGFYSSDKAIAELGYRTRSAQEIIGDSARWYRSQGLL